MVKYDNYNDFYNLVNFMLNHLAGSHSGDVTAFSSRNWQRKARHKMGIHRLQKIR